MAVSRSGMFVRLKDFPEKVAPLQHLEGSGVSLQQEDAFQRCLQSMRDLLDQHQLPAPKVFISYSLEAEEDGLERSLLENFLKCLSQDLKTLGLSVFPDLEAASEPMEAQRREAMASSDYFLVIDTPFYKKNTTNPQNPVALEYGWLMEATTQSLGTPRTKRLLPLCYRGSWEDAFPEGMSQASMYCDFRKPLSYYQRFMGLTPPMGLITHMYPALITDGALQRSARALVADFDRALEAQVPRAHAQSLPERLRRVPSHWDEEDVREKSYSLIELVPRDSLFSDHRGDNHVPLLESASDPVAAFLEKLGIEMDALEAKGINRLCLNALLAKELSYLRHLRWAAVDHFPEKILQGLLLGREDLNPSSPLGSDHCLHYLKMSPRCMPQGRSLLLKSAFGLQKMHAVRGFIRTTDLVLVQTINLFITVALSYRLYEWMHTGHADFAEFRQTFEATSQRGVRSLVYLLSGIPERGLWFLLFSPLMAGVVKGLWDMRRSQAFSNAEFMQLQKKVLGHIRPLQGFQQKVLSYLWRDTLREMLSVPYWRNLSDGIQKAEQGLRWDGRLRREQGQCQPLFETIERVALQGRAFSQMTAMQSLAKIVHSLSIRDFERLQAAGYSGEIFVDILAMKAKSLECLYALAGKGSVKRVSDHQTLSLRQSPAHSTSWVITLYAHYLLWWLGMNDSKLAAAFWVEKLLKLFLQGLFLKTIMESVLELIRCPDKKGFRMFYGDYEIWANDLTTNCFKEFVRRFRLVAEGEPIGPFLEQLQHFDLRGIEALDLSHKALTGNETQAILKVLNQKIVLKTLNLFNNKIDAAGAQGLELPASLASLDLGLNQIRDAGARALQLPGNLQALNLGFNKIGDAGAQGLRLPASLQRLVLGYNQIGDRGAEGLQLPASLQTLDLCHNQIGDAGAEGLRLPGSLQTLNLEHNQIGAAGAWALQLPASLQSLDLGSNQIGDAGARALRLPASLQTLHLATNQIGDVGAQGLGLPGSLQTLDLGWNQISTAGAEGLELPASLETLDLGWNQIGDAGAEGLKLPENLQTLNLDNNRIGATGARALRLPASLQTLHLATNQIGDVGAQGLGLPGSLQILNLGYNQIGDAGAEGLQLPGSLQTLNLEHNQIGVVGAQGLQLPGNLQALNLDFNQIGAVGAKGLQLPASLQTLSLRWNQIGDTGAQGLRLPAHLQTLDLDNNRIGAMGAQGLRLPAHLQTLHLGDNQIGTEGVQGLRLPSSLQRLDLGTNQIDTAGVRSLLIKIGATNITSIYLYANPYNATLVDLEGAIQQRALIKLCQDQLCHANTPLPLEVPEGVSSVPIKPLLFSRFQAPLDRLNHTVHGSLRVITEKMDECFTKALHDFGNYLRSTLSDCPSYFPNIHSPDISDWPSVGTTLWQFNTAQARSPSPLPMMGSATVPWRLAP